MNKADSKKEEEEEKKRHIFRDANPKMETVRVNDFKNHTAEK